MTCARLCTLPRFPRDHDAALRGFHHDLPEIANARPRPPIPGARPGTARLHDPASLHAVQIYDKNPTCGKRATPRAHVFGRYTCVNAARAPSPPPWREHGWALGPANQRDAHPWRPPGTATGAGKHIHRACQPSRAYGVGNPGPHAVPTSRVSPRASSSAAPRTSAPTASRRARSGCGATAASGRTSRCQGPDTWKG